MFFSFVVWYKTKMVVSVFQLTSPFHLIYSICGYRVVHSTPLSSFYKKHKSIYYVSFITTTICFLVSYNILSG